MKKKLSATAVLIFALLAFSTVTALAVSNWGVIARLMNGLWNVREEALAVPLKVETDLKTLRFSASEAYWTEDGLTIAFKTECTAPDCLPYYEEGEHPEEIEYNGETVSMDEFRGDKSLIACEILQPGQDSWTWYEYTDEGLYIIVTLMAPDPGRIEAGTSLTYQCHCSNLQTGAAESGTITVELPPMTKQAGHAEAD